MTGPNYNYERALVPEHLTKQTIETLPFEKAFYVSPGEDDGYEAPAIFVTPDRRLAMSKTESIDTDDANPPSPLELVGVMHIAVMDSESLTVRDAYIADLRFIVDNALATIDPGDSSAADQEEYYAMVGLLEDAVTFEAFIAPEHGSEIDKNVVPGTFYGNPELYPYLEILRKKGDKRMKKFMRRMAKPVTDTEPAPTAAKPAEKPTKDDKQKQAGAGYLIEPFQPPKS